MFLYSIKKLPPIQKNSYLDAAQDKHVSRLFFHGTLKSCFITLCHPRITNKYPLITCCVLLRPQICELSLTFRSCPFYSRRHATSLRFIPLAPSSASSVSMSPSPCGHPVRHVLSINQSINQSINKRQNGS